MYRFDAIDCGAAPTARAIRRPAAPGLPPTKEILIRLLDLLAVWQERAGERRRLLTLDDRMLADIGADRGRVLTEAAKPFWRP